MLQPIWQGYTCRYDMLLRHLCEILPVWAMYPDGRHWYIYSLRFAGWMGSHIVGNAMPSPHYSPLRRGSIQKSLYVYVLSI